MRVAWEPFSFVLLPAAIILSLLLLLLMAFRNRNACVCVCEGVYGYFLFLDQLPPSFLPKLLLLLFL